MRRNVFFVASHYITLRWSTLNSSEWLKIAHHLAAAPAAGGEQMLLRELTTALLVSQVSKHDVMKMFKSIEVAI